MSTVDKMLIKGIRSFDPENKLVITFFKPLTLIVGPNGAGKTTIIECLKLACTGELPPFARNGQCFIHDPKVAGETETKAQIKLRFKTAAGKDVVCIRSFQLTQKASKAEFKAIESVLQTVDPNSGQKVCLSFRCADIDREIPLVMGVSKAMLENVIFVHQDEANWPVQDPGTLKKKFDDIFSATKYTKALEVIKKLHKEKAQEIKSMKLILVNLQTLKDNAYKLRESIAQDQERAESVKIQMQELEKEVQGIDDKIHCTEMKLKDLRNLQDEITEKGATRRALFEEQSKRHEELEEDIEETDEQLKEWNIKFNEKIALQDSQIAKLDREMTDLEETSKNIGKKVTSYIVEYSRLQNEASVHQSLKDERNSAIEQLFAKHNLGPLPSVDLSDDMALRCIGRLDAKMKNLEIDLRDKKKSNESDISAAWERYKTAESRRKDLEARKRAKGDLQNDILKRINTKESERVSYDGDISEVDLARLDEREQNMKLEVERKLKQRDERDFVSSIQSKQSEIFGIQQKIKSLEIEKNILAGDSEERVKLSLKKIDLESLKKKLKKIVDDNKDKIRGALKGRLPQEKDLKKEMTKALRSVEAEFEELSVKSQEAEKEVNMLNMKTEEATNTLNKLQKDMEARKRFVESKIQALEQPSFGVDSYVEALEMAKVNRDCQKRLYDEQEGMRKWFVPFESIARDDHICPCCERPFTAEEEDEFINKQRAKFSGTSDFLKNLADKFARADSICQQLDKLRTVYEEYVNIGKEKIPQTEKVLGELKEELEQKKEALYDILGIVAQVKADKDSVEALMQHVDTADRHFQEIQNLQKLVDDLEYKLDFRGQGVRSMEDIQSELNALQSTRDTLQNEIDKLKDEQRYMENDLASVQLRYHSVREEKLKMVNAYENLMKIEKELEDLEEEKTQVELEQKQVAEELGPLFKEAERLLNDHKGLKDRLDCEYDKLAEVRRNSKQEVDELFKLNSKIQRYVEMRIAERLIEAQEKKSLSESQLVDCNQRKKEITTKLNKFKESKMNLDKMKRNLELNISYREMKARVEGLTNELEMLEKRRAAFGSFMMFESELSKFNQERDRLLSELNRFRGTVTVYESNISKNKVELKQPQFKGIDKKYFDQLIELKTTEMANKDLDKYYNALDKALMRFHSMKMEEINKIIRELWQQTYRGQDIDYIYIESDSQTAGTRSYNYKVVMQSGDAGLEMRGRCSAGQKVLASIIIRLALAETFCLNCGILALDEPTTNLDGPNSESLAAALLRIMEDRKGQENFQLIVITHDERFAQLIGQRQHAEKYYRIYKDEHQHSIISAQEIYD